jgi:uncharacterized membrane protein (DUF485 family)
MLMIENITDWLKEFQKHDNSKVNTGAVFAVVGFITGWLIILFYAFVLKTSFADLSDAIIAMMGTGTANFVASQFQRGTHDGTSDN